MVKRSGMPNFKGCRKPVETSINVNVVREMASEYPDQEAIDFLEFGFPISFEGVIQQTVPPGNRKGAREFLEAIDKYVRKECKLGATLGPFDHNLVISPWQYRRWTQWMKVEYTYIYNHRLVFPTGQRGQRLLYLDMLNSLDV